MPGEREVSRIILHRENRTRDLHLVVQKGGSRSSSWTIFRHTNFTSESGLEWNGCQWHVGLRSVGTLGCMGWGELENKATSAVRLVQHVGCGLGLGTNRTQQNFFGQSSFFSKCSAQKWIW